MQAIELNNGVKMPAIGYGTYQVTGEDCVRCVREAVAAGYRLIDTAQIYGNEAEVGMGIRQSGIDRQELFITTKVWFHAHEAGECRASVFQSMEKLGVDYLDLVLIHWPFGNTYAAWRDLETLYGEQKIRAIGVSNYMPSQLIDLIHFNKVVPAVNQVETNLVCQQQALQKVMKQYNVVHQAYSPFGQGRFNAMFEEPVLKALAGKYGKTPHQVALRFLVQSGISVLPKTLTASRMRENRDIWDFSLQGDEMTALRALDQGKPLIGSSQDGDFAAFAMTW